MSEWSLYSKLRT